MQAHFARIGTQASIVAGDAADNRLIGLEKPPPSPGGVSA